MLIATQNSKVAKIRKYIDLLTFKTKQQKNLLLEINHELILMRQQSRSANDVKKNILNILNNLNSFCLSRRTIHMDALLDVSKNLIEISKNIKKKKQVFENEMNNLVGIAVKQQAAESIIEKIQVKAKNAVNRNEEIKNTEKYLNKNFIKNGVFSD